MSWDDYDVFCRVIEHRSFTRAARAMERPKSSISAAIGRLEAALGTRLIERTTRQLQLTEPGEVLHQSIGVLFERLREARSDVLAQGDVVTGTLRIAGPHEFSTYQLGPVACEVMAEHPQLKVSIDVADDTIDPVQHRYDIVFTRLDGAPPAGTLLQRRVFTFERGIFGSPTLLGRHREPAQVRDLMELPLLCAPHDREWLFTAPDGSTERMPTLTPRLSSSNSAVRFQAAVAGLGVTRIPVFFGAEAVNAGQLRRLLTGYTCEPLSLYVLLPTRRLISAKVTAFLAALDRRAGRVV